MTHSPLELNRRDLLALGTGLGTGLGLAAGSTAALAGRSHSDAEDSETPLRAIDTNVSLYRWPFRRLPLDEPDALVRRLTTLGVVEAWAGSFEALLHRDLAEVNRRLAELCGRYPLLKPIGAVNPALPGWRDDLRRCVEQYDMRGIRLHPNYHGYPLSDPRFEQLLVAATGAGLFVQIAAALEDVRTQHRLVRIPDVDLQPLAQRIRATPGARMQVLNARPNAALVDSLADVPGVHFDTARVESTDGVPELIRRLPVGRVLFGTHAPFLIPEAALIRVHESGRLNRRQLHDVLFEHAVVLRGDGR